MPPIARIALYTPELVLTANVQQQDRGVLCSRDDVPQAGHGLGARLELSPSLLDLDDTGLDLAGPPRQAADEDGDPPVAAELGDLEGGGSGNTVTSVVEDEALFARHPVPT